MRESRTYGSVRGMGSNPHSYSTKNDRKMLSIFSWHGKLDSVASLASGGVSEANVAALFFGVF